MRWQFLVNMWVELESFKICYFHAIFNETTSQNGSVADKQSIFSINRYQKRVQGVKLTPKLVGFVITTSYSKASKNFVFGAS